MRPTVLKQSLNNTEEKDYFNHYRLHLTVKRQKNKQMKKIIAFTQIIGICILFFSGLQSCNGNQGPKPIRYGKDQCVYCKMTISDARFGTQLVTKKGRVHNFDDLSCMVAFVKKGQIKKEDIAAFYVPDYTNENTLLPASELFYLKSEQLKSPMRGDIAAFSKKSDLESTQITHGGEIVRWEDLWK